MRPLLITAGTILLLSGIGRDDVPLEKYYEFAKDSAFNCVGLVFIKNEETGSCILLNEWYVLTAAHNIHLDSREEIDDSILTPSGLKHFRRPAFLYVPAAENIYVKINGTKSRCKKIFVHPEYANSFYVTDDCDLAILELEKPVTGTDPPVLYPEDILNKRGIAVGCGAVGTADDYNDKKKHRQQKMAGENMIDSVKGIYCWADMDHPRLDGFNRTGSDSPLPLEWIGYGGDCGSALFIEEGGTFYLAGVSMSTATYADADKYGKKLGVHYGFTTNWIMIKPVTPWIRQCLLEKKE